MGCRAYTNGAGAESIEEFIMRRIAVGVFDLLFTLAWIGFGTIFITVLTSLLSNIIKNNLLPNLLPGAGQTILLVTAALWMGLFIVAIVSSYREAHFDYFRSNLWRRILLAHFILLTGPTAYYFGYLRSRITGDAGKSRAGLKGQHKKFLDMLYFMSYWGTLGLFVLVGIFLLLPNGPLATTDFVLMISILATLPLVALSALLLNIVLVIDAANRPRDQWERINFLRMLNPWSGVFGMRKYYLHFLRPEIEKSQ